MTLIERREDDREELFAWWDGTELTAGAEFLCAEGEVVVVLDAASEALLATLGPGRHGLPPALEEYVGGGEVLVIFLTTAGVTIEAEGSLDEHDDAPHVEFDARVTVTDPVKALELLPRLDDDEAPEEGLAEELMLAVAAAAEAHGGALPALQASTAEVAKQAGLLATGALAELGYAVSFSRVAFAPATRADA